MNIGVSIPLPAYLVDPAFMALAEEPIPLEQTLEYQAFEQFHGATRNGTNRPRGFHSSSTMVTT